MRLIFCGTPLFAVPSLRRLIAEPGFEVAAVITQPDRPQGRGNEITFSPVKQIALDSGIPAHQPVKIRAPEFQPVLEQIAADAIVIIAYGQIIPARLLTIPRLGWINLHASLLPKYRGAAPINWAIVSGETATGVTTMRIDAGMDTGDLLLQKEIAIGPTETAPELAGRMSEAGAPLMIETLRALQYGALTPRAQDHAQASVAPILKKEDGRIDWRRPAREIFNRMRGFAPWPGATTTFRGLGCQLWGEPSGNDDPMHEGRRDTPGTIHFMLGKAPLLLVVCGAGALRITGVKLEGRKQISATEFLNGAHLLRGEIFGA
ncbi:MAG: methionyl-tRNA formyltransferase [Candidatus Acidiferrum sp.]|jgi:methionyl-tRNA formyltransferase